MFLEIAVIAGMVYASIKSAKYCDKKANDIFFSNKGNDTYSEDLKRELQKVFKANENAKRD